MTVTKTISICVLFLGITNALFAQKSTAPELFMTLKQNDSLLFNEGFNKCDIKQFETLIAEDFEFYHDKTGITESKAVFMDGIKNGLCNTMNTTTSRRELVHGSLSVFPLFNNGVLYGAIQKGEHSFFETQEGKPEQKASLAKFTHLWIKTDDKWQVKRVLSYNHIIQTD